MSKVIPKMITCIKCGFQDYEHNKTKFLLWKENYDYWVWDICLDCVSSNDIEIYKLFKGKIPSGTKLRKIIVDIKRKNITSKIESEERLRIFRRNNGMV
tara:strand:+ start:55 stop:351 length:297 start_codon:yes stop_codon:yes gene_type:complete